MAIIKGGTAKVQKGDTLSAIAKAAGTTVSAIAKANNIKNVNVIKPGQVFTIPGAKNTGMEFYPGTFTPTKYAQTGGSTGGVVTEVAPIVEEEGLTQADIDAAVAAALAQMGTANAQQFSTLQAQIAALLSSQKNSQELAQQQATLAAAQKAKQEEQQRVSIVATLTERFKQYGLGSLINKIKDLAIDGATESTITLALQESDEYKTRFKANQSRIAKGLAVLQPAEYLNVEDGYRQVLRSYGLRQFDTDEYVQQFIANDVSPTEFSNRVVTAVQRVQNADPAIMQQLRDFYGVGQQDLVAYVLDPEQQFQKIERQIAASEIGVAAGRQGLRAGVSVAEQLAAQGITEAEAQKGYASIADILPTAEKLSDIYGTTLDAYGQTEAEQEVFNSLASAQRKRQKLTAREVAAFSGKSGASRTSLTTSSVGQF
jgi:LysM repeat protein